MEAERRDFLRGTWFGVLQSLTPDPLSHKGIGEIAESVRKSLVQLGGRELDQEGG
jgi:hypothetical protein